MNMPRITKRICELSDDVRERMVAAQKEYYRLSKQLGYLRNLYMSSWSHAEAMEVSKFQKGEAR